MEEMTDEELKQKLIDARIMYNKMYKKNGHLRRAFMKPREPLK